MFENSYIYGSDISYFSRRHNVLRVLQTFISSFTKFVLLGSLAKEEREASSALFWKLKGATLFVGDSAQIAGIYG